MSKRSKTSAEKAFERGVEDRNGPMTEADAYAEGTPQPRQPAQVFLVLGAKAPKHRVGHTGTAWAAITPLLPATAETLAKLAELKVPQCGGPKGNGMLYVSYAIRRGWLTVKVAD